MDDLPNEETQMESNGDGIESTSSLERETRANNQVETFNLGNGDVVDDLVGEEAAEDVEIEVDLVAEDFPIGDERARGARFGQGFCIRALVIGGLDFSYRRGGNAALVFLAVHLAAPPHFDPHVLGESVHNGGANAMETA